MIFSTFSFDMEIDLLYLLQKKDDYDVATGMNYGVGSFLSWSKFICNSKTRITRNRRPLMIIAFFEGEHLEQVQTSQLAPYLP